MVHHYNNMNINITFFKTNFIKFNFKEYHYFKICTYLSRDLIFIFVILIYVGVKIYSRFLIDFFQVLIYFIYLLNQFFIITNIFLFFNYCFNQLFFLFILLDSYLSLIRIHFNF